MLKADGTPLGLIEAGIKFGLGPVLAVFLVWAMVTRFDRQLGEVHDDLGRHTLDTAYVIKTLMESKQILLRICINDADTIEERRACLQTE